MNTFLIFLILIIAVAFFLVVVIMVQNPKGGGLSSTFGGGSNQQLGGVKKTTDFLDKSTWTLAVALLVLILTSSLAIPRQGVTSDSKILENDNIELPAPTETPATDNTSTPADTTTIGQ